MNTPTQNATNRASIETNDSNNSISKKRSLSLLEWNKDGNDNEEEEEEKISMKRTPRRNFSLFRSNEDSNKRLF